ncbi:unnamed protein product [Urochloa decumbens]|uniref:No apical meristem-associated C-terminal domain-containing protein n=1 Tax=Urochloa decumbens TaxID=240449 RepID=A0ABC9AQB8_9POAL
MDSSENRGSQPKKPRKPFSVPRRSAGAPAVASSSCLSAASGATAGGPGAAAAGRGGGTSGHPDPSAFLAGISLGGSSPSSSDWLYPPGGFVNSLQMPYLYATCPNASQLPENSHFVGGPSTRGTPSPNDVRNERKWAAYVKKINKEAGSGATPANVVSVEDFSPKEHPIGHKKAKDERNGKRKAPEAISAIGEKLDKFIEASTKAENMAEAQHSLADKKIEVAKLNHKAA